MGGGPASWEQTGRPSRPNRSPWAPGAQCCAVLHGCGRSTLIQTTRTLGWPGLTGIDSQPLLFPQKEPSVWERSVLKQRSFYKGEKPCGHAVIQPWQAVCGELCCNRAVTDALLSSSDTVNHRWDSENIKGKRSRKIPQRD